ncbi:MAG: type II secretion system minor pseudopilin GspK [Thermodesulfobacteriota bacterium]|nr:type II secretion system minor pseudopilin GspK [Thermodesulfobacteriota bacterium]
MHQGSALVIALLIVVTLTGLTVAFSEESGIDLSLAGYSRDGLRAYQAARSGVHVALSLLGGDEDRNMDSLTEEWGRFSVESFPEELPEEISVSGRIMDENSKININHLIDEKGEIDEVREEQLLRLFQILGLEETLINPLLDWLDSDDIERMNGAESFFYQNLEAPYLCANGPFLTIGQILLVKEFKSVNLDLTDFLTIYSDGKININTASSQVLQGLDEGIDSALAELIIDYRQEESFLSINDLKKVAGIDEELFKRISGWLTVKSSAFSIEIEGNCREAASRIKTIIIREGDKSKIIYWQVM